MSATSQKQRILLVDDHIEFCDSLKARLEQRLPVSVDACYDTDGAIDRLMEEEATDPYRFLILDMFLPQTGRSYKDGDIARGLRILLDYGLFPSGTPVIVFTNYATYENCVDCMRAGAFDYLPKTDPQTGEENTEKLIVLCQRILRRETGDGTRQWLEDHIDEVVETHGGHFVAIVEGGDARSARLGEEPIEGMRLLVGESYEEVRYRVLQDKNLRWRESRIIKVPTREDWSSHAFR